jgi:DNA invertase Pin-like site-specific DNA recombinase
MINSLAIPFRNHAHWLRTRFDERTGHDSTGFRSEGSWLRANLPREGDWGRWNRPELQRLLDHLRKGDVLVVWKLDRLSRSLRDVLTLMERIQEAKAGFRSLTEAIDTTTPAGRMMMQMIGSFAEFERAMLRERTRAGLESARGEGRIGGRRPKLLPQQQTEVLKMVTQGKKTAADAARLFNVHPATIGRLLARKSGDAAVGKR